MVVNNPIITGMEITELLLQYSNKLLERFYECANCMNIIISNNYIQAIETFVNSYVCIECYLKVCIDIFSFECHTHHRHTCDYEHC